MKTYSRGYQKSGGNSHKQNASLVPAGVGKSVVIWLFRDPLKYFKTLLLKISKIVSHQISPAKQSSQ